MKAYTKPHCKIVLMDMQSTLANNSELDITDEPVEPGRGSANGRRWGNLWDEE